jgi:hypothetical protein
LLSTMWSSIGDEKREVGWEEEVFAGSAEPGDCGVERESAGNRDGGRGARARAKRELMEGGGESLVLVINASLTKCALVSLPSLAGTLAGGPSG